MVTSGGAFQRALELDPTYARAYAGHQGMAAAASLIMFLPNLVIFIIMQSKVIDTMAHSGIK